MGFDLSIIPGLFRKAMEAAVILEEENSDVRVYVYSTPNAHDQHQSYTIGGSVYSVYRHDH